MDVVGNVAQWEQQLSHVSVIAEAVRQRLSVRVTGIINIWICI